MFELHIRWEKATKVIFYVDVKREGNSYMSNFMYELSSLFNNDIKIISVLLA